MRDLADPQRRSSSRSGSLAWLCAPALLAVVGIGLSVGVAHAATTVIGSPDAQLCYEAARSPAVATLTDVEVCSRAVRDDGLSLKDLAATYSNRGLLQSARGRHEEALKDHERAIHLMPELPRARLNRANVLVRMKRYADALDAYEQLLRDAGSIDHMVYFNRAMLHLNMDDRFAAREDLLRALERAPDRRRYLNALADFE